MCRLWLHRDNYVIRRYQHQGLHNENYLAIGNFFHSQSLFTSGKKRKTDAVNENSTNNDGKIRLIAKENP